MENHNEYPEVCLRCQKSFPRIRGLCEHCYNHYHYYFVRTGKVTWEQLIREGKALGRASSRQHISRRGRRPVEPLSEVMPDRCIHNRKDGECPECERNQRAGIVASFKKRGLVPMEDASHDRGTYIIPIFKPLYGNGRRDSYND